jgi:ribosomal protein S20
MNSISSVNPTTGPSQTTNHSGFGQIAEGLEVIGSALQSGDVASANSALTALQQALQDSAQSSLQTATSQPFGKNSQANTDYKNLTHALQFGDLSTAQQAYASLQNDLKSAQSTNSVHRGHHQYPHSSNATPSTSSSTPPTFGSATSSIMDDKGNLNVLA